jgi:phenylacetate-CoA ligase
MPVTAYTTQITRMYWFALTLREHLWHKRDFSGKLASIRPEGDLAPGQSARSGDWGPATSAVLRTGPAVVLSPRTDIGGQLEWLLSEDPDYLLTLPSNLRALALAYGDQPRRVTRLKGIRTYGEVVHPELRELCMGCWGLPPVDVYSAQEVGYIALQCAEAGSYHVQAESVLVEVVDEAGEPCASGQTGRVVVTTLQNFGSPLIRYALGDYAEVGEPCACGRGLPVIRRIQGRQRNMVRLPDGRLHWPSIPVKTYAHIAPIRQLQLAQVGSDRIEARLVAARPLSQAEEEAFAAVVRERLGYPFLVTLSYREAIPRSRAGKFEDFLSEIG